MRLHVTRHVELREMQRRLRWESIFLSTTAAELHFIACYLHSWILQATLLVSSPAFRGHSCIARTSASSSWSRSQGKLQELIKGHIPLCLHVGTYRCVCVCVFVVCVCVCMPSVCLSPGAHRPNDRHNFVRPRRGRLHERN